MPTIDFLPFATDPGADVMPQADYLAAGFRGTGFETGIALPDRLNKVWRQSAFVTAAIANLIADRTGQDVLDDGDLAAFKAKLLAAIQKSGYAIETIVGLTHAYTVSSDGLMTMRSAGAASAMIDTLPGGGACLPALTTLTIYNNDATQLLAIKADAGSTLSGAPRSYVLLGPGQSTVIVSDGANYFALNNETRTRLNADTTMFVSTTGDNANVGLTAATPWATQTFAWSTICATIDLAGFTLTVQCAAGTYAQQFAASGRPTGANARGCVVMLGAAGLPTTHIIDGGANSAVRTFSNALKLQGFQIQSTGNAGIYCHGSGSLMLFSNIDFGACPNGAHISAVDGASVYAVGNYRITGAAVNHLRVDQNANISTNPDNVAVTVTLVGTPAFSGAFANASACGAIRQDPATTIYGGTGATGQRYNVVFNGVILTNGGGANYYPGSIAGATATGGQYQA
jgi:hypothetical protein